MVKADLSDVTTEQLLEKTGQRAADATARAMGSWRFVIIQTLIVGVWIGLNVTGLAHFDIYPFILLNLAFSLQAAYAAPILQITQNHQSLQMDASLRRIEREQRATRDLVRAALRKLEDQS